MEICPAPIGRNICTAMAGCCEEVVSMVPTSILDNTLVIDDSPQPPMTWKLDREHNRLIGIIDEKDALEQAVYIILNVERYAYLIHTWNFGIELQGLFGMPTNYVQSELKRVIAEALEQDDRVESADSFSFIVQRESLIVQFTVHSIYGDIPITQEVKVSGV